MTATNIFQPYTFTRSGLTAKNRITLAPMTNGQSHADGTLGDDEYRWLIRRAKEDFGVIITCAAHVSADGQGWPGELGIWDDSHISGLKRLANGIFSMVEHGLRNILPEHNPGVHHHTSIPQVVKISM